MGSYRNWHDAKSYKEIEKTGKWSEGYIQELGKQYGLNPDDYQPEDTGSQEEWDPDGKFKKEALRRANNDYDYRRAQEAASLSSVDKDYEYADKKWSQLTGDEQKVAGSRNKHLEYKESGVVPGKDYSHLPSNINSLEDNWSANNWMKQTYKDQDLGDKSWKGGYGSSHQRASVKDYFVNLDRTNFTEKMTNSFDNYADKNDQQNTPELPKDSREDTSQYQYFKQFQRDPAEMEIFGEKKDVPTVEGDQGEITVEGVADQQRNKAALNFADNYKLDLVKGLNLKPQIS